MKLIPGSGRFAGSSFAPLVPGLWEHPYLVRDFTRGLEGQAPLSETVTLQPPASDQAASTEVTKHRILITPEKYNF